MWILIFSWTPEPLLRLYQRLFSVGRVPNHWKLPQVEVPAGFRLSAASGHHMQLLGCFQITLKVLGRYVNRPVYVLSGLAKQHAILGMDFVREQQLCIEADHVFFKKFPLQESCLLYTF